MDDRKIEAFRKTLRSFERLLDWQMKTTNCCGGVSLAQCHHLLALKENQPCSMMTLAENLGLEKSTVSRTVDGLVKIGLLNRETNSKNRRSSILTLTRQGENTVSSINEENNQFFQKVFSYFPIAKIDDFLEVFELLTRALNKTMDSHCKSN